MLRRLVEFLRSEEGQAMSEYGLVLALIAIGVIAAVIALRDKLSALFHRIADTIDSKTPSAP